MKHRQVYDLPSWGKTDVRVLNAAASLMTTRGLDGLTITAIAKEAGVSRPTVYRRWPSVDEIMRATLLRTTLTILEQVGPLPATRDAIVSAVLHFAKALRTDPLFRSLIQHNPEIFIRYSLQRLGASQLVVLSWLADAIEHAQEGGTARWGSPSDIGVMLLLLAQSAILSHHTVTALIGNTEFDTQLAIALDGYLRP